MSRKAGGSGTLRKTVLAPRALPSMNAQYFDIPPTEYTTFSFGNTLEGVRGVPLVRLFVTSLTAAQ